MRWDFSATKGLLHLLAQKEFSRQEQERQNAFELQKQREKLLFDQQAEEGLTQRRAESIQNMTQEEAPRWRGVPFPTSATERGQISPKTLSEAVALGTLNPYLGRKKSQVAEPIKTNPPTDYQKRSLELREQEIGLKREGVKDKEKAKRVKSKEDVEKEINALTKQSYALGNKMRSFDLEFFMDEAKVNKSGEFVDTNAEKLYSTAKQSYMDELASIESEIQRLNEQIGGEWKKPDRGVKSSKKVVRTGIDKSTGKKVIQYEDGTTQYTD
jgi:hypothetical protein